MESRNAPSTSAEAIASTPKLVPIRISRRCLRVIPPLSAFKPQTFDHVFDPAELFGIIGECALGIGSGCVRFASSPQHHIGAQQSLPAINVVLDLDQYAPTLHARIFSLFLRRRIHV
jgi:hypothetical protein